jgi:excisionase family DNA binding protein
MEKPIPPGNLTRAQAAERLGVSLTWFDALVRRGELSKYRNPKTRAVWFAKDDVENLARQRTIAEEGEK